MYQILDRGFDREYRFYVRAPASVEVGERVETDHGSRLVYSIGRIFGDPPECYAYVDITAEEMGAPESSLTPDQARNRASAAQRYGQIRGKNDTLAAEAILAALKKDGWSSRRNTTAPGEALRRVYRELVADGTLELDGYRYVLKRNT